MPKYIDSLTTHRLFSLLIAALIGLMPLPAFSQTGDTNDIGDLSQPNLPEAFKTLSTQDLKGTYTEVYFRNSLIQRAHDTDRRWVDLRKQIEEEAIIAYPFDIRLSPDSHTIYALVCDSGPSADPQCSLYNGVPTVDMAPKLKVQGLAFIFPGDGCLYVAGHTDNMFDMRRKFCENGGMLKEVRQPFQHVGSKSEAGRDLDVYSDRALKHKSGQIAKGAFVEVLVEDHQVYLVRDEFGITGWTKAESTGGCPAPEGSDILGLCYAGD